MGSAYAKATARQGMIKTGDGFPSPWTGYVVASESRPESGLLDLGLHFGIGDRAKRYLSEGPAPPNLALAEDALKRRWRNLLPILHSGREAVKIYSRELDGSISSDTVSRSRTAKLQFHARPAA